MFGNSTLAKCVHFWCQQFKEDIEKLDGIQVRTTRMSKKKKKKKENMRKSQGEKSVYLIKNKASAACEYL